MESVHCLSSLGAPKNVASVLNSFVEVVGQVHSCLVDKSSPGNIIELRSEEMEFGSSLLSLLAGKLNLKAWLHKSEVRGDLEVQLKCSKVKSESGLENNASRVALPQSKAGHP